ncbi:unnamed protein product, partial [Brenthis ino]
MYKRNYISKNFNNSLRYNHGASNRQTSSHRGRSFRGRSQRGWNSPASRGQGQRGTYNRAEEGEDVDGSDSGPSSTLQTPKPPTSRRRPAKDIAERQMSSAFGQLTNMLAKRQKESQPPLKEEDDCELYGKLLTQKLRELPSDDRKLMMYDIDTLFVNRIKEKQRCQAISSYHSVPYQMRITSPMPNRPSTSQTSYFEPFPNTSPYLNRPSPSQTSYSEPTILHQPSTFQMSHCETLPVKSPAENEIEFSKHSIA